MHPPVARCSSAEPRLRSSGREVFLRLSYRLSSVQCLYEELVRTMELRFYCSDCDSELLRDFLMLKAFDVVQNESCSRSLWKLRDRPFQIDPQLRRITLRESTDLTRVFHWQHSRMTTL